MGSCPAAAPRAQDPGRFWRLPKGVTGLLPQPHGLESLLLGEADAIPDDATALDLGDLPEVLVYADPTPCAAGSHINMKKDEIVQVAHFPDRQAPVGKGLKQACPPSTDRIVSVVGSLQFAQPRVPLHLGVDVGQETVDVVLPEGL